MLPTGGLKFNQDGTDHETCCVSYCAPKSDACVAGSDLDLYILLQSLLLQNFEEKKLITQ